MITGRQVRAARALLNWKQEMLAEKALVALTALKRLESERQLQVHEGTRDQVRRVLKPPGSCLWNLTVAVASCSSMRLSRQRDQREDRQP